MSQRATQRPEIGFKGTSVPRDRRNGGARNPGLKLALYKPFEPRRALLPHRVPTVKKCDDASSRLSGAVAASPSSGAGVFSRQTSFLFAGKGSVNGSAWTISPSN
jgi:hypothetical protein